MIRRRGRVIDGKLSPWLKILKEQGVLKKALQLEFGLTASARARMGAAMATPQSAPNSDASKSALPSVGGRFAGLIGKPN